MSQPSKASFPRNMQLSILVSNTIIFFSNKVCINRWTRLLWAQVHQSDWQYTGTVPWYSSSYRYIKPLYNLTSILYCISCCIAHFHPMRQLKTNVKIKDILISNEYIVQFIHAPRGPLIGYHTIFSNTKKDNSSLPPWPSLAVHHCMPVSWPSWFVLNHKVGQSSCPFHLQSGQKWALRRHIPSHFCFHKITLHWCPVKDTFLKHQDSCIHKQR